MPENVLTNGYLYGTIFLAFAYLYPDFTLYIFFILPIRIKWLALVVWISYFIILIFGSLTAKILMIASLANFLLFFFNDILVRIKFAKFKMGNDIKRIKKDKEHIHKCNKCGITDKDDHSMQFRYCSDCSELTCFCMDHINNHEHLK
jgi:hypothetical protein